MNLTEIEALADAVYAPNKDDWELKMALIRFDRAANPQTVKAMCALIKQQHEALLYTGAYAERGKALAAYEEFNK
jgi:hypothetical protein